MFTGEYTPLVRGAIAHRAEAKHEAMLPDRDDPFLDWLESELIVANQLKEVLQAIPRDGFHPKARGTYNVVEPERPRAYNLQQVLDDDWIEAYGGAK